MSQKINRDRDPAMMKHIIVKQGDSFVKLVMPPMDKEAKLDHKRCTAYLLDMIIKYGPALEVEKNQKEASDTSK